VANVERLQANGGGASRTQPSVWFFGYVTEIETPRARCLIVITQRQSAIFTDNFDTSTLA
jgi:hypothetical protein